LLDLFYQGQQSLAILAQKPSNRFPILVPDDVIWFFHDGSPFFEISPTRFYRIGPENRRPTSNDGWVTVNKPGALAQWLDKLATRGVNLNSIYATAPKGGKKAVVVYTAEVEAKAAAATA
jgi:hypothetical protein